jgi:hypothetical protein
VPADVGDTAPDSRRARSARWEVASAGAYGDSPPAWRVASRLSRPRTASSPHRRRVGRDVQAAGDGRQLHPPPCGHDDPARPIQCPTTPEAPPADDRGQQPCPTRHHLRVLHETWHVGCWRHIDAGNASEKRVAECAGAPLPPGSSRDQARGFQGVSLQDVTSVQPQNTPRGGELTPPEQATTRRRAAISRRIAHAMGGVTRDRLVKEKSRLLKDGIRDTIMETCCGLPHLRLQYRPWHYAS